MVREGILGVGGDGGKGGGEAHCEGVCPLVAETQHPRLHRNSGRGGEHHALRPGYWSHPKVCVLGDIHRALQPEGVGIPWPQTLHLDVDFFYEVALSPL